MASEGRLDVGLVNDDYSTHALVVRLSGPEALCGAGRITQRLAGWFDPNDRLACPRCATQSEAASETDG